MTDRIKGLIDALEMVPRGETAHRDCIALVADLRAIIERVAELEASRLALEPPLRVVKPVASGRGKPA